MGKHQRQTTVRAQGPTRDEGLIARLRQTIAAERELLAHPMYAVPAGHVIAASQARLRLVKRHHSGH